MPRRILSAIPLPRADLVSTMNMSGRTDALIIAVVEGHAGVDRHPLTAFAGDQRDAFLFHADHWQQIVREGHTVQIAVAGVYEVHAAVKGASLSVPDGAFLVQLGPSGCGKTTLLRMLAGLELPSAGQIVFDTAVVSDGDRNWAVETAKRNSGLVFQCYALWPHMTVRVMWIGR